MAPLSQFHIRIFLNGPQDARPRIFALHTPKAPTDEPTAGKGRKVEFVVVLRNKKKRPRRAFGKRPPAPRKGRTRSLLPGGVLYAPRGDRISHGTSFLRPWLFSTAGCNEVCNDGGAHTPGLGIFPRGHGHLFDKKNRQGLRLVDISRTPSGTLFF